MTHLALRPELDRLRCDEPGCDRDDHLLLLCKEHQSPTWVSYSKGELTLECAECDATVLVTAVAG